PTRRTVGFAQRHCATRSHDPFSSAPTVAAVLAVRAPAGDGRLLTGTLNEDADAFDEAVSVELDDQHFRIRRERAVDVEALGDLGEGEITGVGDTADVEPVVTQGGQHA